MDELVESAMSGERRNAQFDNKQLLINHSAAVPQIAMGRQLIRLSLRRHGQEKGENGKGERANEDKSRR